ncbi:glycosyltransferase [Allomuricauda sp. XS_ASV26]|uniref:glycosyltransferase n=1 Tax=Flavobacteriaceae TaxID=49546 RepID=UPI001CD6CEBD|nr:glycosyltransferase [Allomuricauda ruestringensis]MCA0959874.1 glycosyltransferase [Allomuricauda ruestringensis]
MIRKIIFVIPSLRAGGAERVMSFLAANLPKNKYQVSLIVIGHKKDQAYSVESNDLEIVFLGKDKISDAFLSLFKQIKKRRPHLVISSISHLNIMMSFMACFFLKTVFIAREANVDRVRKKYSDRKKRFGGINLKKIGYRFLGAIICQSQDMYDGFISEYPKFRSKTYIINNPITDAFILKHNNAPNPIQHFITVGSLHPRKGHDRILRTLSKYPHPFKYTIIGDGVNKEKLAKMAKSLNISEKINHIPHTSNVAKYLAQNDFYLQGSYVEGFPNAVIESCAVGTPVLAFDAPGGINEIIENGINGHVSVNEEEYLNNLRHYTSSNHFNTQEVRSSVVKRYGKKIILGKYEDLFENMINKK